MSKNSVKRTVIHSDDIHRMICDGVLNDHAEVEKTSVSMVIENLIMWHLLPKNPKAMQETALLYYPADVRKSISEVLSRIFDYYAAGTNWNAAYDNGFALIQFTSDLIANTPNYYVTADAYLDSKLDSIAIKLESHAESEMIKTLIGHDLNRDDVINLITLIIDNWQVLGNWTITYRMLCVLMKQSKPRNDTARERVDLIKIIDKISQEWD